MQLLLNIHFKSIEMAVEMYIFTFDSKATIHIVIKELALTCIFLKYLRIFH